jgi:hypothetical protein
MVLQMMLIYLWQMKKPSLNCDALNSRGSDGWLLPCQTKSMMPCEGEEFGHLGFMSNGIPQAFTCIVVLEMRYITTIQKLSVTLCCFHQSWFPMQSKMSLGS